MLDIDSGLTCNDITLDIVKKKRKNAAKMVADFTL